MKVVGLISKASSFQIVLLTLCLTAKLLHCLSVIFQNERKKIEKSSNLPWGCMTSNLQKSIRRKPFSNQIVSFTTAQQPGRAP